MKKQKFYPKQAMKSLQGRSADSLNDGDGMAISCVNDAKAIDLIAARKLENAHINRL